MVIISDCSCAEQFGSVVRSFVVRADVCTAVASLPATTGIGVGTVVCVATAAFAASATTDLAHQRI